MRNINEAGKHANDGEGCLVMECSQENNKMDVFFLNKEDGSVLYKISGIMLIILVISLSGLIYGFKLAFDNLFISVLISVFNLLSE